MLAQQNTKRAKCKEWTNLPSKPPYNRNRLLTPSDIMDYSNLPYREPGLMISLNFNLEVGWRFLPTCSPKPIVSKKRRSSRDPYMTSQAGSSFKRISFYNNLYISLISYPCQWSWSSGTLCLKVLPHTSMNIIFLKRHNGYPVIWANIFAVICQYSCRWPESFWTFSARG